MNLVLDRTQRWMTTTSKWSNHSSIWDPFGIDAPMHLNIYVNYWTSPLSINCTKQGSSNISLWSLDIDSKSGKYAEVFRKKNTTLNLWTNRSSRYVDDHNELGSSWNFWKRKEKKRIRDGSTAWEATWGYIIGMLPEMSYGFCGVSQNTFGLKTTVQ